MALLSEGRLMPFNAQSYYRNKAKREARAYLAEARMVDDPVEKARKIWWARSCWKTYLGFLRMDRCDADLKRFRRGEITYQDFMSKWDIRGKGKS